ncbi:MAG: hypothetical protein GVY29_05000 [Spirochaetes bacterium]|nr:hypothetical protein [Spirochaetota bacterium]
MAKSKKNLPSGSPETRKQKRQEKDLRARRRRRGRRLLAAGVAVLVLAAAGALAFASNQRADRARDLSLVGSGTPAVVQVHDHTCPVCTELRGNVQRVQDEFSDEELLIRVADVHTDEGLAFAARYTSARRATLLYINGSGELVRSQTGAQGVDALRRAFSNHAAAE